MEVIAFTNQFNNNIGEVEDFDASFESTDSLAVEALSRRIADELKKAKRAHLTSGEVLLPTDLTKLVAKDIFALAEAEPYGLKGCTIFIKFDGADGVQRDASVLECDPNTPSTFILSLTLKQALNGWNAFLPQFFKKMTRGGTIMISSDYVLEKKKLYRSHSD